MKRRFEQLECRTSIGENSPTGSRYQILPSYETRHVDELRSNTVAPGVDPPGTLGIGGRPAPPPPHPQRLPSKIIARRSVVFIKRWPREESVVRANAHHVLRFSSSSFPARELRNDFRLESKLGEGEIRTPGTVVGFCGFQDRRIQPLCHLSTLHFYAGFRSIDLSRVSSRRNFGAFGATLKPRRGDAIPRREPIIWRRNAPPSEETPGILL